MESIVIVSGYFDPLHVGHLEYIEEAKKYGDELWVIVNSDYQASLKKTKCFMKEDERIKIITNIKGVDKVFISIDTDRSICGTLKFLVKSFPENDFVFANGGDVNSKNSREHKICKELGILPVYGLGKKIQSSSWLIKGLQKKT